MNTLQFLDQNNEYEITIDGRVISHKTAIPRELKPTPNTNGYLFLHIYINNNKITATIHQLVALTYLEPQPSPKHQLRHLDGNKLNNHAHNLAWGTSKNNKADSNRHGTISKGKKHATAINRSGLHNASLLGHAGRKRMTSCEPNKRPLVVQVGQLPLSKELAFGFAGDRLEPRSSGPSTRRRHIHGLTGLPVDLEASSLDFDLK